MGATPRIRRLLQRAAFAALPLAALPAQGIGGRLEVVDGRAIWTSHLGETVPAELRFVDENHREVRLGDYLTGDRPVILWLGYYGCPAMCGAVLNGLVAALERVTLTPAKDFRIVSVSIDPSEQPPLAREKKNSYLQAWPVPGASDHWHFLTGAEPQVRALADAVGFGYVWKEEVRQYDHPPGIVLLAPDGRISRYLQGAAFSPRDLRLSLVEAAEGKIGTAWDRVLLSCYTFDASSGTYSLMVMRVVRIAGIGTIAAIALLILVLRRRERRQRPLQIPAQA
jgi:protein SCO1/2